MYYSQVVTNPSGIGALELKRHYQKNMFLGTAISSAAALAVVGLAMLYSIVQPREVEPTHILRISTISQLAPPPPMTARAPQIHVAQPSIMPPSIGIPTPVPDEEIAGEVTFATRAQLAQLTATRINVNSPNAGATLVIDIPEEEFMPAPGEFIAVEEYPVPVYQEPLVYPEMAERARIEGVVYIRALVDKEGRVREAIIEKPSGTNAGFEEAALKAAMKNRYKPAIQNGRPIPVWVSYRTVFELK